MNLNNVVDRTYRINLIMLIISCLFSIFGFYFTVSQFQKYGFVYEVETIINGISTVNKVFTLNNIILCVLFNIFTIGLIYNMDIFRFLKIYDIELEVGDKREQL